MLFLIITTLLVQLCYSATLDSLSGTSLHSPTAQCLDSIHHKPLPDSKDKLNNLCAQWSNYSCCTQNSSLMAHEKLNHYGFDIEHCGKESLSSKCHKRFVQDLCYYDCDPYIGPWIVRQNWSRRQERIMYVPLCKSECDQWWEDCKDSSTCVTNWAKHFVWVNESGRRTNKCPSESECKPFKALFNSATEFCEKIWDNSWRVNNDEDHCIQLNFDGNQVNPNKEVAEYWFNYSERLKQDRDKWIIRWISLVGLFLILLIIGNLVSPTKFKFFILHQLPTCFASVRRSM